MGQCAAGDVKTAFKQGDKGDIGEQEKRVFWSLISRLAATNKKIGNESKIKKGLLIGLRGECDRRFIQRLIFWLFSLNGQYITYRGSCPTERHIQKSVINDDVLVFLYFFEKGISDCNRAMVPWKTNGFEWMIKDIACALFCPVLKITILVKCSVLIG